MAQSRDNDGRLSGIKLTALSDGLRRVAVEAKRMKGVSMSPSEDGKSDEWEKCCDFSDNKSGHETFRSDSTFLTLT